MTFATAKNTPSSKKIILFEIDIPAKNGELDFLINHEAGIWKCTLAPGEVTVTDDHSVTGYYSNDLVDDGEDVGSLVVFGVSYSKLYSLEELRLQTEAFYYDPVTTIIYIVFEDKNKPVNYNNVDYISLGMTTGFSNMVDGINGGYYDDVYYEPRIVSVPVISKTKDPLFFGFISFPGGTVSLNNHDGKFDRYKDLNIYNQPARLKLGFEGFTLDEFRTVYTGFVESYTWDWSKFTVKINDPRKKLTTSIPKNRFKKTDYADLNDSDVDKLKPVCYGHATGAPLLCVNDGDESAATYLFFLSDTEYHDITSVSTVYLDGIAMSEADWSINLATGIISIAATKYVTRDDQISIAANRGSVTADFIGADIHNALAIIKDVLNHYGSQEFTPTYFNTAEYNRAMSIAADCCWYSAEEKTIKDVIEDCCVASDVSFIVQDDGKYTARTYSTTRSPVRTIKTQEWISEPATSIDESKFLSSLTVLYNKNQGSNKFERYHNADYEVEVTKRYKGLKTKELETTLTTESGAASKSERIMELSKLVPEVVKRTTKIQNIDLEIMDFIIASPVSRPNKKEQFGIYEITGINKNLSSFEVALDMRFIRSYTPEPETLTYDGILWNHKLYSDNLYSQAGEL
jgi:hypothetical protein